MPQRPPVRPDPSRDVGGRERFSGGHKSGRSGVEPRAGAGVDSVSNTNPSTSGSAVAWIWSLAKWMIFARDSCLSRRAASRTGQWSSQIVIEHDDPWWRARLMRRGPTDGESGGGREPRPLGLPSAGDCQHLGSTVEQLFEKELDADRPSPSNNRLASL